MASPAGCSGYRCESPPCTEPCPTSVVPVHRPHLSTAWLPSVHPPGRPGRRGRSARGAAASGLTERSDCRHHASHVATLCHRLVRRRLNTLLPPDLPKSLPQLLTDTLSSKDPRSHPSSPIPPSTPPPQHVTCRSSSLSPKEKTARSNLLLGGPDRGRSCLIQPVVAVRCMRAVFAGEAVACGKNLIRREALDQKLATLHTELAGPQSSPVERLLVERIVT